MNKFLLSCVFLSCSVSFGMTSIKMTEKEKVKKSSVIAELKCTDVKTQVSGTENKIIFTSYEFVQLAKPVKGTLAKDWKGFTVPGGTVGKETMSVEGVIKLQKGKSYLIFLDSILMPFGNEQSAYIIKKKKGRKMLCFSDNKRCIEFDKYKREFL